MHKNPDEICIHVIRYHPFFATLLTSVLRDDPFLEVSLPLSSIPFLLATPHSVLFDPSDFAPQTEDINVSQILKVASLMVEPLVEGMFEW